MINKEPKNVSVLNMLIGVYSKVSTIKILIFLMHSTKKGNNNMGENHVYTRV